MNSMGNDQEYAIAENERVSILDNIHVGIWRIEHLAGEAPRLFGDAGMYAILGADAHMPPQQLYRHWHERIEPAYVLYVDQAMERLISTGKPVEVEYVWNHPRDGKRVVRCNGTLSSAQEGGKTEVMGLHWDITDKVATLIPQEDGFHIIDHFKISLCGKYLIKAYEDVLLIDRETKKVNLIAYRNGHCEAVRNGATIMDIVEGCVHEEDQEKVRHLFADETLLNIIAEKRIMSADFRRGKNCGKHEWVRGTLYPIQVNGVDEILFIAQNVQNEYQMKRLQEEKMDALNSVIHERSAIYEYDFALQQLQLLRCDPQSVEESHLSNSSVSLPELVEKFCEHYVERSEWPRVRAFLSHEMLAECAAKKNKKILAVPLDHEKFLYVWAKLSLLPSTLYSMRVYIVMELMDRREQLYPALKSFIRNTVDFFYYLDLRNDYFLRFVCTEEDDCVPPKEGRNYTQAMLDYADQCIPKEERAFVKEQISPAHVLGELKDKSEFSFTASFIGAQGEVRKKHFIFQALDISKGQVLLQRTDITEMYRREQILKKAQRESITDALTQLYNRLGSERMILKALAEKDESKNAALIMLDLDNFKMVNDRFGHQEGDRILCEAASKLKEIFRAEDIIGRMGGDEFVVFLPNMMNKADICAVLQRVVEKLSIVCGNETEHFVVTASVGATVYCGQPYSQLYREADIALYHAKEEKNKYSLFESEE